MGDCEHVESVVVRFKKELLSMAAPPEDTFVDGKHNSSIRDHSHQVSAQTAIQTLSTLFFYYELECLPKPGVLLDAIHDGLPQACSEDLVRSVLVNLLHNDGLKR